MTAGVKKANEIDPKTSFKGVNHSHLRLPILTEIAEKLQRRVIVHPSFLVFGSLENSFPCDQVKAPHFPADSKVSHRAITRPYFLPPA